MTSVKKKTRDLHILISESDLFLLKKKAEKARLSLTDYITSCCLRKQIFVVEGLDELNRQHRSLGNNINQLTRLANSGRVEVVNLGEFLSEYREIGESIIDLLEKKRWRNGNS